MRGNYLVTKTDEASFRKRIELYRRAVAIDPKFARAHATLAFGRIGLTSWNFAPPSPSCEDAEHEARLALALDDQSAAGHTALADVLFYCRWNFSEAEREIKTAIQLSPNYASAHYEYAFFLAITSRFDEAIAEAKSSGTLDPGSPRALNGVGYIYYYAHRYDEAITVLQSVLEIEPSFRMAHVVLSMAYRQQVGQVAGVLSRAHGRARQRAGCEVHGGVERGVRARRFAGICPRSLAAHAATLADEIFSAHQRRKPISAGRGQRSLPGMAPEGVPAA